MTPAGWICRCMVAGLPALAAACTSGAGETAPAWFFGLLLLLGLGWAAFPESAAGAVALFLPIAWWGVGLRDGMDLWALPAAAALLSAHVAGVLLAYGPPELPVDGATARLWLRRAAVTFLVAPAVFGLVVLVRDEPPPGSIWAFGLVGAFIALLAASLTLSVYGDERAP